MQRVQQIYKYNCAVTAAEHSPFHFDVLTSLLRLLLFVLFANRKENIEEVAFDQDLKGRAKHTI